VIAPVLERLLDPRPLAPATMRSVFDALTDPAGTDAEKASVLVALAARPDRPEELELAARELRRRATPFRVPASDRPVDLCGSGGAPVPSFNVSTVSALVVAAAGAPVVKHGNRSARGVCGSSDLLEALGLPVTRGTAFAERSYAEERLAFLHAPTFHPAMAAVREARRIVGIPTIFNRLGPLANPASVPYQVVGTRDVALAELYAQVLPPLGVRRGLAMSSSEGCDEFSPTRPTTAVIWDHDRRTRKTFRPESLLDPSEREGPWGALAPPESAAETRRLLEGGEGARRGSVVLTSGVALWVAQRAATLRAGLNAARHAIDSGEARGLLDRLVELGRSMRETGA
jgi:anthranilate phosphoribosyltransferase